MSVGKRGKTITAIRIRPDRAELLKDKAMQLTVKQKEYVKEADIVNFLIDNYAEDIDIDDLGFKMKND